jgi:hypothetical protein
MPRWSEPEPTAHAHHLHRAPLAALSGPEATLVQCPSCSSMRQVGKLGERRAQALGTVERLGLRGRAIVASPDWLKMKNPNAPAVRREAEEDWGR